MPVGKVTGQLDDETDVLEITDGQLTGVSPLNFQVQYPDGPINHLLLIEEYATDDRDVDGSWCLVVPKQRASGTKGKTKPQQIDVEAMSATERAALMAKLHAFNAPTTSKGKAKAK